MSIDAKDIFTAQEKFGKLIENESARIERMKQAEKPTDFSTKDKIVVGILPGDGIGPILADSGRGHAGRNQCVFLLWGGVREIR